MRYLTLCLFLLGLTLASCKKDIGFEFTEPLPPPPFYLSANYTENLDQRQGNFHWNMVPLEPHQVILTGVASATGVIGDHKYIVAMMGYEPRLWLQQAPFSDPARPFMGTHNSLVGLRITSARPASEADRPFSKAELEELLRPGVYAFGEGPLQVELNAVKPEGEFLMQDLEPVYGHSFNQFEILSVEDYRYDGPNPQQGKAVHFRGRAMLKYPYAPNRFFQLDVQGRLLFDHLPE
jgi:hypothetical protein